MGLPSLDSLRFRQGSLSERRSFANELLQSCSQYGFVKIINHGIPDEKVSELFEWTRKFFELSAQAKAEIAHPPGPEPQRGWSCMGAEKTAKLFSNGVGAEGKIDAREHFDQGAAADGRFPNRWPAESRLPGFRQFMEIFYDECHKVGSLILEALELALDLQGGRFVAKCRGNASELRLNHYPPIDIKEMLQGEISRIHPHTDLGVITCLFQDSSGGLEVADRDRCGEFIPVTSRSSSEMVVNISETFQRWTNGRVQAGIHQVTIPPHLKGLEEGVIPERYTIAFFVKADRDTFAGALEEFVGEEKPALYDNMTALEFHQWRLATAY